MILRGNPIRAFNVTESGLVNLGLGLGFVAACIVARQTVPKDHLGAALTLVAILTIAGWVAALVIIGLRRKFGYRYIRHSRM